MALEQVKTAHSSYWEHALDGFEASPFPDLTGLSALGRQGLRGHSTVFRLLRTSLQDFKSGCRGLSTDPFIVCRAAWAKVLGAYVGETDVCFGRAKHDACSLEHGEDDSTPLDAEVLPFRVKYEPRFSNRQLLDLVKCIDEEQQIHRASQLVRTPLHNDGQESAPFDTLLFFESAQGVILQDTPSETLYQNVQYSVICIVRLDSFKDTVSVTLHCRRSFVLEEDTHHVLDLFEKAIELCIQSSAVEVFDFSGPSIDDDLAMSAFNTSFEPATSASGPLLHSGLESLARTMPDAAALDFLEEDGSTTRWTFSELDQYSDIIADALLSLSLKVEESVPICVPKTPYFYTGMLGVLKSGCAFTPFDPQIPEDRKTFMVEELGAKVILSLAKVDMSWCSNCKILNIDQILGSSKEYKLRGTQRKRTKVRGSNIAYNMYTSGSTGKPKAVSVEHRNAVQTASVSKQLVPFDSESRLLQFADTGFDMCYYDCFLAWTHGFCLCSTDQDAMFNDLTGVINNMKITLLDLTPSMAATLEKDKVPSVQWLYCIGEAMSQELVDTWEGKAVNSYGPTEAAQCVTIFPVEKRTKSAVIGKPFSNTSFTVLQKHSSSVAPVFGAGELCIGGLQVARGYFNNEELTRERFIYLNKQRVYKTGDLVRMLGNGNFEFIGRADDQVKIHGQRVELEEINYIVRKAADKIDAATTQILKADDQSSKQLVAFLVTASDLSAEEKDKLRSTARDAASNHLPTYMVPNIFICIEKIPLSTAGKADKKALAKIYRENRETTASSDHTDSGATSAWSAKAEALREAFSAVSGVPQSNIQPNTTIYQLGLDSLSAIKLASELKRRDIPATATDVRENPSVRSLIAILEQNIPSDAGTGHEEPSFDFQSFDDSHRASICSSCSLRSKDILAIRPCTSLQAGMLAQSIHSEGADYFNHLGYELPDDIDLGKLQQAWGEVIEKFEVLRSGFTHVKDPAHQFAMVTYLGRNIGQPVEVADGSYTDWKLWYEKAVEVMLLDLHLPVWRLKIERGAMHFVAHHSIYDEETLYFFFRDVATAYHGLKLTPGVDLEPVLARILRASNEDDEKQLQFWQNFGRDVSINRFPNLTPLRVTTQAHLLSARKCAEPRARLSSACRDAGITMQAAGQAAWSKLLAAYIGEAVVTFGTVLSGRISDDADNLGFPCISTVPTVANTNQPDDVLLESLMRYNASVQRYQFTPLQKIQRWVNHPDQALFDTIFMYQMIGGQEDVEQPWQLVEQETTINYSVSIELEPVDHDALEFRIHYREDMLPQAQAELLLRQLDLLLTSLLLNPKGQAQPVFDPALFSVTPSKEAHLSSNVHLLHQFVEESTRKYPDRIALEFAKDLHSEQVNKKCWTYKALNLEGNKIAHLLREKQVSQGSIVAICFEKCPEASFAMLGILKAGCSFMALDPASPMARKKFILEDSKATCLLTMSVISARFELDLPISIVNLDAVSFHQFPTEAPALERSIEPSDLSYCLYTSGTTGTPKGCTLSHENAVQAMLAFQRLYTWNEGSRWLQFASFHFDVSVMEQYWSWSVGICVVSADRDSILQDLASTIRQLEITHLDLTPSLAAVLDPDDVPSLRRGVFVTGGEMLKQEILEAWGTTRAIHNGYGPTEATIGCTMFPRVPDNGKPSNIGRQFDNVGTFVVNPEHANSPVLRGAVGELCISGVLVAKGYLNRPKLTEEKFIAIDGNRSYRTGDLVRILHDNSFDFLGRADDQVKLRGQRLEIGEINHAIKEADRSVMEATTIVTRHGTQQKEQLVAFVVGQHYHNPREAPQISLGYMNKALVSKIRHACQESLPGYMIPTHFIPLTRLPLSSNNKVDAHELQELYNNTNPDLLHGISSDGTDSDDDSAFSQQEMELRDILSMTLSLEAQQISKSSNFFQLGLDSVSSIGLAHSLRDAGFPGASTSTVMKNSTIRQLAQTLSDSSTQDDDGDGSILAAKQTIDAYEHRFKSIAASTLCVKQSEIECLAPCTALQQGMISRSLDNDKPIYYQIFNFELNHGVDLARLRNACQNALDNIQILRTKILQSEDGFIQVVLRNVELPWTSHRAAADGAEELLTSTHRAWWLENREGNLIKPWEIVIVETPNKTLMGLHIFHALFDANSLPILMECVLAGYNDEPRIDYGPKFHDALPCGPLRETKGAKEFWTEHLGQLREIDSNSLESLIPSRGASDTCLEITIENLTGFEDCRRKLNVTHQAILQACWAAVLQSFVKTSVVLGLVLSGRSIDFEGAQNVVGPMFNTIPFLPRMEMGDSWSTYVTRCHDFNSAAMKFQHTPLRDIQKWCRTFRNAPGAPLFETLFVFQKRTPIAVKLDPIWQLKDEISEADYPLALDVEQIREGHFNLTLVAQAHLADENIMRSMLDTFRQTLETLVKDPDQQVSNSLEINQVLATEPVHGNAKNKHANGELNGHSTDDEEHFEWTVEARAVRDQVARLADVDPSSLTQNSSILELGLDSIDAVKLSSKLRRTSNILIPVSRIMRALTIGAITSEVTTEVQPPEASQFSNGSDLEGKKRALATYLQNNNMDFSTVEDVLPPTPLQEAMVAEMINSDFTRYMNHDILQLSTDVNSAKLKESFQKVADNSSILRTTFKEIEDPAIPSSFAQIVFKPSPIGWTETTISADEEFKSVQENIKRDTKAEFGNRPPFSLTLVKIDADCGKVFLILSLAHALYDGQSLALLHHDVEQAYFGKYQPRPPIRDALLEILDSSSVDAEDFWRDLLSGFSATIFPRRDRNTSCDGTQIWRKEYKSKLKLTYLQSLCKRCNVTISTLTQTAWSFVLASFAKKLDVSYGVVLSGRNSEATIKVLFPTMNTVIVRSIMHGTRRAMLQYTQENMSSISRHQHIPLRQAQRLAGKSAGARVLDALFIYQGREDGNGSKSNLYHSVAEASEVEFPICVEAELVDDAIVWRAACNGEVLEEAGTAKLLEHLDSALSGILESPDKAAVEFQRGHVSICEMAPFSRHSSKEIYDESKLEHEFDGDESVWNSTEAVIRDVLSQVARVEESKVRKDSTLFHLGLDSISAIKVSALLRKRSIILTASQMLEASSVARMAKAIEDSSSQPTSSQPTKNGTSRITNNLRSKMLKYISEETYEQIGVNAADVDCQLPATAGQIFLLSNWQNFGSYVEKIRFRIHGTSDVSLFRRAWEAFISESPIMRTTFAATGDHDVPVVQVIVRRLESNVQETQSIDATLAEGPNDLQPFHSIRLIVQVRDQGLDVGVVISHSLYDGVSLTSIMGRLQQLCNDLSSSPPATCSFEDFIGEFCTSEAVAQRKEFWSQYLENARVKPVRAASKTGNARLQVELVNKGAFRHVRELECLAREDVTTSHAFFLAAFARIYAELASAGEDEDVVFGIYIANRSAALENLPELIAPTMNVVPLRVQRPLVKGIRSVARQVRDDLSKIGRVPNSGVGMWEIDQWTKGRVRPNAYVNFLRLPDTDNEGSKASPMDTITLTEDANSREKARLVEIEPPRQTFALERNAVRDVYLPSIQVDASVRDVDMDVGVTAPESMLDLDQAKRLVEKVTAILCALTGEVTA